MTYFVEKKQKMVAAGRRLRYNKRSKTHKNDRSRAERGMRMRHREKTAALALAAALLCGCGGAAPDTYALRTAAPQAAAASASAVSSSWAADSAAPEKYTAALGDTVQTLFFTFVLEDARWRGSYGGYTPPDGFRLLEADVTVRNTFTEALPMSYLDFQLQWGPGAEDFGYEPAAVWNAAGAMPESYTLAVGESASFAVLYAVPQDGAALTLAYQEHFTDGTTGDCYLVPFEAEN